MAPIMLLRNSKNFSFPAQFSFYLMFLGISMAAGSFLGSYLIWPLMTGTPMSFMLSGMTDPANYYPLVVIQAVLTFFIFFLSTWLFALVCYRKPWQFLGFGAYWNSRQILLTFAVLVLVLIGGSYLAELTRALPLPNGLKSKFDAWEASREAQEAIFVQIDTFPKFLISLLLIGVLPAVFEEVFFRGGVQNLFTRWFKNPWVAILVTSLIFSLIHLSFYGFFVRFALSVVLGLLFYYSYNIWIPILLHFLFNGIQVTALYFASDVDKPAIQDLEEGVPWYFALFALVVLIFVLRNFKKVSPLPAEDIFYEHPRENDFQDSIAKNS